MVYENTDQETGGSRESEDRAEKDLIKGNTFLGPIYCYSGLLLGKTKSMSEQRAHLANSSSKQLLKGTVLKPNYAPLDEASS